MNVSLSDITVLIPSIGRKTLLRTIDSIPSECKVILLISGTPKPNDYRSELNKRFEWSRIISIKNKLTAGVAKGALVKECTSKYFLILDDDDWLPKGYLESCIELLNEGMFWIAPSYINSGTSTDHIVVDDVKTLSYRLFEYEKYSTDYIKYHLYPVSCCLIKTDEFRSLGEFHHLSYADDAIPMINFMIHYPGAFFMQLGIEGDTNNSSLSRRKVSMKTLMEPISEFCDMYMKSQNEYEKSIWMQSISNLLARVKHINNKSNGKSSSSQ